VNNLAPLAVVLPLLVAALLVGLAWLVPRRVVDAASLLTSAVVAVFCALLVHDASDGRLVYWLGGWEPRDGVALGISFAIDQVGAGLALFCAVLFVAAFALAWRYFVATGPLFHALMLVFLAAMVGFSFTGDLFNLFVFFELLSVSAYALVSFDIEEEGPLQGALNFAVTNTVGAFFILTGIGLLYGRTGALNMAQIGEALTRAGDPDGLVIVAFTLIVVGFLVKAAVVPFHFWLADAYSVAPTPVCLLLSAAVSELGLFALARVYWTVFSGTLGGGAEAIQWVLVCAGALTALVGAAMCFGQRHLKRLLAFATVSHVGLFLIGIAVLKSAGLAGTMLYVMADGALKATLFICVGVLQHLRKTADELRLRGLGRDLRLTGPLFVVCGLAAASLPPFGPWWGKSMLEHGAAEAGFGWVSIVVVLASALTGAAILRAAGRVFAGWGPVYDPVAGDVPAPDEADPELDYRHDRVPRTMTLPALCLAAFGLVVGLVPGLAHELGQAAAAFTDRAGYTAQVLHGGAAALPSGEAHSPSLLDVLVGLLTTGLAVGLAAASLFTERVDLPATRPARKAGLWLEGLRRLHSGYVGDYVAWLVTGTAVLAALFAVTLSG
jgi:multicomponent Na+:H+ antiporter subunit D